jgi:hypothetical protein
MVNYIILGLNRSGNTHTHLAVAGHPMVSAFVDEVKVAPFYTEGISVFTRGGEMPDEKERSHMELFRALTSLTGKPEPKARGIHSVMTSPEEAELIVNAIQKNYPSVKIILISRLNILARLASEMQALKSGKWSVWEKVNIEEKISLSKEQLSSFTAASIESMRVLEQLKNSHQVLDCIYEYDIENGNRNFYPKILDFIGVPFADITWKLTYKIAPAPHQFIEDYGMLLDQTLSQIMTMNIRSDYSNATLQYLEAEHRKLK